MPVDREEHHHDYWDHYDNEPSAVDKFRCHEDDNDNGGCDRSDEIDRESLFPVFSFCYFICYKSRGSALFDRQKGIRNIDIRFDVAGVDSAVVLFDASDLEPMPYHSGL